MKFAIGDRVAWSHQLAPQHAEGSLLKYAALPPGTPVGTVIGPANEAGSWFEVLIDTEHQAHPAVLGASETHPDPEILVLTEDELLRVAE